MNGKNLGKFITTLFLIICMAFPVNAQIKSKVNNVNMDLQTVICKDDVSRVKGVARGRLISSAELQISDDGNGVLGVYAETLCHIPVEKIYMIIFLEVWDEENQDWKYLSDYEYTWNSADFPNRPLTDVSVSFDIHGLRRGKTYSLRAYHSVDGFDSTYETMSTETSGIVLD